MRSLSHRKGQQDRQHGEAECPCLRAGHEMARPTGVGHALATYRIPIEGRDEWVAAARVKSA
jgi:hypothetical protein